MKIASLKIEHYEKMIQIWEESGLSHRPKGRDSREEVERQISEFGDLFIGAFQNGELIGVIVGTDDGRKGWINRLAVLPEHRGKGVGLELIRAIELALGKRNRKIISVLIETPNDHSISLFRKAGYETWEGMAYLSKRDDPEV